MAIPQNIIERRIAVEDYTLGQVTAAIAAVIAESDDESRAAIAALQRQLDEAAAKASPPVLSEDKTTAEKQWREYCDAIVEFKVLLECTLDCMPQGIRAEVAARLGVTPSMACNM